MTADQIANLVEALIPFTLGISGLIVSRKKSLIKPGLTKYLKPLSILCIGIGIIFIAKAFMTENHENVNYEDVVKKINESSAGTYVDEVTRIDSVTIGIHNEFIYNYSLLNIKSSEVNYDSIGAFENTIRESMNKNSFLEKFLKNGKPVIIKYYGADSIFITEIRFDPKN